MFNVNPVTELIKNQIMNLNQNLSQIANRLGPHSFWVGKLCRASAPKEMVVRVIGLDSAGITFRVVDPGENKELAVGSCHFIGFDKPSILLRTLSKDEEDKYQEE